MGAGSAAPRQTQSCALKRASRMTCRVSLSTLSSCSVHAAAPVLPRRGARLQLRARGRCGACCDPASAAADAELVGLRCGACGSAVPPGAAAPAGACSLHALPAGLPGGGACVRCGARRAAGAQVAAPQRRAGQNTLGSPRSMQGLAHARACVLLTRLPGSSAPRPVRPLHLANMRTARAVHGPARLGWGPTSSGACRGRRLGLPQGVHAAWYRAAGHALLGVLVLSLRPSQQHMPEGSTPPRAWAPGRCLPCMARRAQRPSASGASCLAGGGAAGAAGRAPTLPARGRQRRRGGGRPPRPGRLSPGAVPALIAGGSGRAHRVHVGGAWFGWRVLWLCRLLEGVGSGKVRGGRAGWRGAHRAGRAHAACRADARPRVPDVERARRRCSGACWRAATRRWAARWRRPRTRWPRPAARARPRRPPRRRPTSWRPPMARPPCRPRTPGALAAAVPREAGEWCVRFLQRGGGSRGSSKG